MNIVNQSFFIGEINIPNTGNAAIFNNLNNFIAKYEPECLLKILGYPLYKKLENESSQRMTDLLTGAEYTDQQGNLQKWQGIKHDTTISLVANYIYFFFQRSAATLTTGVSTSVSNTEGGVSVSPQEKMVEAWNFFSDEVASMLLFLWNKNQGASPVYPEFSIHQMCITKNLSSKINTFGI